jgi:hypothetical protein
MRRFHFSLRSLGVLCVSALNFGAKHTHRRDGNGVDAAGNVVFSIPGRYFHDIVTRQLPAPPGQEAQPVCPAPQGNLEEVAEPESTVPGDAMENLARLVGVRDHPASPEL